MTKPKLTTARDYLSICEVAFQLNLSERTIVRRIKDKSIPALMIGGVWRIHNDDLETTLNKLREEQALKND